MLTLMNNEKNISELFSEQTLAAYFLSLQFSVMRFKCFGIRVDTSQ